MQKEGGALMKGERRGTELVSHLREVDDITFMLMRISKTSAFDSSSRKFRRRRVMVLTNVM